MIRLASCSVLPRGASGSVYGSGLPVGERASSLGRRRDQASARSVTALCAAQASREPVASNAANTASGRRSPRVRYPDQQRSQRLVGEAARMPVGVPSAATGNSAICHAAHTCARGRPRRPAGLEANVGSAPAGAPRSPPTAAPAAGRRSYQPAERPPTNRPVPWPRSPTMMTAPGVTQQVARRTGGQIVQRRGFATRNGF